MHELFLAPERKFQQSIEDRWLNHFKLNNEILIFFMIRISRKEDLRKYNYDEYKRAYK